MAATKKKRPQKNLAAGRPPTIQKPKSISRKTTKTIINKLHLLEKRRLQAKSKGDKKEEDAINAEIEELGGLEKYQQASLQGQSDDRGGDSSRVLMQWLEPCVPLRKDAAAKGAARLRMLEVGALSTHNACSKSDMFEIERIDLNSQGEGILQQDFMERPLPKDDSEKFDIISLSLVLNFVPDPRGRGEMLLRTLQFLHKPQGRYGDSQPLKSSFPSLFLVLPAPCVSNSRYLDDGRLIDMMESMGYVIAASKTTQRLVYYLWKRESASVSVEKPFPKKEIRSGPTRNNFAIVVG
ncbi:putative methyltransferase-domain-containing protein [Diplogelasinospora grovesii]|uniref:25S rRNA adenine-N(1) methyltransferase n=1 Tax=Diplogelasinospora grovesii TaxID=303347 RepID=A0AAN6NGI4_9PEZI|nr:putative methyltransferase-domain-containing protein [Diplogelasinospora grovesii]